MYIMCILCVYYMYIICILYVYYMYIICIYIYAYYMYIMCILYVYVLCVAASNWVNNSKLGSSSPMFMGK